jgi:hypothetical protein
MFNFERLGLGLSREVFAHPLDHTLVVKVPRNDNGIRDNAEEMRSWTNANAALRESLAPCVEVLDGGELIMRRTTPVQKLPHAGAMIWRHRLDTGVASIGLPQALSWDMHSGNLGIFDGRVVMHDYAACTAEWDTGDVEIEDRTETASRVLGGVVSHTLERVAKTRWIARPGIDQRVAT